MGWASVETAPPPSAAATRDSKRLKIEAANAQASLRQPSGKKKRWRRTTTGAARLGSANS